MNAARVGMDPVDLLDVLCTERLSELVKTWMLDNGRQGQQIPTIISDMMPSASPTDSIVPFVHAYIEEGEDTDGESTTSIGIIIVTYSQDKDGWRDCKNLAFAIRRGLLQQRMVGRYRLLLPLKYRGVSQLEASERSFPTHYFRLTTTWQMALILEELPDGLL